MGRPARPQSAARQRRDIPAAPRAVESRTVSEEDLEDVELPRQAIINSVSSPTEAPKPKFSAGDLIECQLPEWNEYFKGVVNRYNVSDRTYAVHFDDGERRENVDEQFIRKLVIINYSVDETVEAKCIGWTKYYKGKVTKVKNANKYDVLFADGERKMNVLYTCLRKVATSPKKKSMPRANTKKPLTFAAWKRGGASSVYGRSSATGKSSRPSTVPLGGTRSGGGNRSVYVGGSRNKSDGSSRRPFSASGHSRRVTPSPIATKRRPQSANGTRKTYQAPRASGKPLPIRQLRPDTAQYRRKQAQYSAACVDPFMNPLLSAIYLDRPENVAEYVLQFAKNFLNNGERERAELEQANSPNTLAVGQTVEAKVAGWTQYYRGTVTSVNKGVTYDIKFDDGEKRSCVKEEQLKLEGSSAISGNGDSSAASPPAKPSGDASVTKYKLGNRVEAKCSNWTKWFSGNITQVNSDGTYNISFEDGDKVKNMNPEQIRFPAEAPAAIYKHGARVQAKCRGWTKHFPGNVTSVNEDGTYNISFEDGDKKKNVKASEMIPGEEIKRDTPKAKKKKKKKMTYKVGDTVEAKATGWKQYYLGRVEAVDCYEGHYTIKFEDGEVKSNVEEFQVRKFLTETYKVSDIVDVKCVGWSKHYRGEIVLVNPNRSYNIKFEDGELKRGVRPIEVRGLASDKEVESMSEKTEERLKVWSKDEKLVGDFISKVIDMVGDEDFIPCQVFRAILSEDAGFPMEDGEFAELTSRFGDAKGDNINCVDFVEYVQLAGS